MDLSVDPGTPQTDHNRFRGDHNWAQSFYPKSFLTCGMQLDFRDSSFESRIVFLFANKMYTFSTPYWKSSYFPTCCVSETIIGRLCQYKSVELHAPDDFLLRLMCHPGPTTKTLSFSYIFAHISTKLIKIKPAQNHQPPPHKLNGSFSPRQALLSIYISIYIYI